MDADPRPPLAIGHVTLRVHDVATAADFYAGLGLRPVLQTPKMAILELRGGTHLMLFQRQGQRRERSISFDLMADDLAAFRRALGEKGIAAGEIRSDPVSGHQMLDIADPDGRVVVVYSSHTDGRPV
jgi:catechol 2,3-dioxygenase-like lactoylglutathione lyase family enzyme